MTYGATAQAPRMTGRHSIKKPVSKHGDKIVSQIIASWVVIALSFSSIGVISGLIIGKQKYSDVQTTHAKEESAVVEGAEEAFDFSKVEVFGGYDTRVFTEEISLDWEPDGVFTPITDEMDTDLQEFVYYLCKGYNLDFTLVMALIKQESHFDPSVISATNDYGLMQINRMNHQWLTDALGVSDFTDPYQNVRAGTFILRKLFESYQNTNMVLMAYNMGEAGAARLWKNGVYNTNYTDKVLAYQAEYNK